MRTKHKKVRWHNVCIFIVCIMMLISCLSLKALGNNKLAYDTYQRVMIKTGDTVWGLIKEYNPNYQGNMNKAIYIVHQINGLQNSSIVPGKILYIPLNL